MTEAPSWWSDDDRLLAELGAAVRDADEVPESVLRAGKAAYAWRTVDAELAELRLDSGLAEPAGFRREPTGGPEGLEPRTLSFTARDMSIEVEVHPDAVRGQLAPSQPATLLVRVEDGPTSTVPVDELGWFVIQPVPDGRFRLHVRTAAGAVITDWISAAR